MNKMRCLEDPPVSKPRNKMILPKMWEIDASKSSQEIIAAWQNRLEIVKVSNYQGILKEIPRQVLEKTLHELKDLTTNHSEKNLSNLEMQIRLDQQRKTFRRLMLELQQKRIARNKKIDTASRLIFKINFIRQLTLILLASSNVNGIEYNLALSRDLVEEKMLMSYHSICEEIDNE